MLSRYDPAGGLISVVAAWSSAGAAVPVGTQASLGGIDLHTLVFQTGREVRLDGFSEEIVRLTRELGVRETVGVPVTTEGRRPGIASSHCHPAAVAASRTVRLAGQACLM